MAVNKVSAETSVGTPLSVTDRRRKSSDIGWEYGVPVDPTNTTRVKCKLCGKIMSGGATRMKRHVAHISGNVSACPNATLDDQARCRQAIMEAKNKRKRNDCIQ